MFILYLINTEWIAKFKNEMPGQPSKESTVSEEKEVPRRSEKASLGSGHLPHVIAGRGKLCATGFTQKQWASNNFVCGVAPKSVIFSSVAAKKLPFWQLSCSQSDEKMEEPMLNAKLTQEWRG